MISIYSNVKKKNAIVRIVLIALLLNLPLMACNKAVEKGDSHNSRDTINSAENDNGKGDKTVITIAVSGGDYNNVAKAVEQFNAEDNGYFVEMKKYCENFDNDGNPIVLSQEEYQMVDFQLIQDVLNSDSIDIVFSNSFIDSSKYEILKEKGAFVNLYPFMDSDKEVNTETLDKHILSLNETNGNLFCLPTFYMAWTLSGKKEYVGDNTNWTADDFVSHWNQMPDNATINGSNYAEYIYNTVLAPNISNYIDYEKGTVNFDSDDFQKMLGFCGQFPSIDGEKKDYDSTAPNFVSLYNISGVMSASVLNDDLTLVGYPSSNGKGAFFSDTGDRFSICKTSSKEKQEGAWKFIRTFATYEYQIKNDIVWTNVDEDPELSYYESERGLCVNKQAFNEIAQGIIEGKYYNGTFESKGEMYTISLPTQVQLDNLCKYLNSISRWDTMIDSSLKEIVDEEVGAFFSKEQSLDEAVEKIQNRASIWLSEQT